MTTVCWMTDIHPESADDLVRGRFFGRIAAAGADCVLITGDIADGADTAKYLEEMARRIRQPIYFVLGNHDFYGGPINAARQRIVELTQRRSQLIYLTNAGVVELSPSWALVGHDGWPDARLGDYENSTVFLPDFVTIEDLAAVRHDRSAMRRLLAQMGDQAAGRVAEVLSKALAKFPNVVLATHVPPFRQAAWYRGGLCDDQWLPYFSCQAMGQVLLQLMQGCPDRRLLVLCGHTHGAGEVQVLENLRVITGGAESGSPIIQGVLEFDGPGVQTGVLW